MELVNSETLSDKFASKWLSYIILKTCSSGILSQYRDIERSAIKIHSVACHLSFNETCLNNNLLPTYTNIRLHDDAARKSEFATDFRKKLIERQVKEQKEELSHIKNDLCSKITAFKTAVNSNLRYNAFVYFLQGYVHVSF